MHQENDPLVSIIVPVYGVEELLPRCVDSILNQTYINLQVILVDDGSPDRCPEICDAYAEKDSRVRVIHKENGGVSSARNRALPEVRGKYITFCDSDDALDPDWIQGLVRAGEENQADTVVAGYRKIYADGREDPVHHEEGLYVHAEPEARLRYMISHMMTDKHAWEVTTRLLDNSLVQSHGICFCETCHNFAEDLSFLLCYSLYSQRVVSVPLTGYRYYMRENSMMNTSHGTPRLDSMNEVSLFFRPRLRKDMPEKLAVQYGSVFHFLIMMDQYAVAIKCCSYHHMKRFLRTISREEPWKKATEEIFSCRALLEDLFGKIPAGRIRIFSRYLLHGCWLQFKIERFLFFKWNRYQD